MSKLNSYKVSDNIINLLKHYNYKAITREEFDEFSDNFATLEITTLVEEEEDLHKQIDHKLLDNLEAMIDELLDISIDDIDMNYINERLKS